METRIKVSEDSKIVGRPVKAVENRYKIKIKQLDNFSDRILPFFFERVPCNRKIKAADYLTVVGKRRQMAIFEKVAARNNAPSL